MAVALSSNPSPDRIHVLSSSLESLTVHDTPHEVDLKIAELRTRALETIRNYFPITTLFTPELKIDLGVFIKDQMLFRKIAEFIAPLGPVDRTSIARHFEKSSLLMEIKALFNEDPTPYLESFYEACADVLNKKSFSKDLLKSAIEGRIFTLKNALIAQHSPTQAVSQKDEKIKEEGGFFIRECLRIHACSKKVHPTFKAELVSTAEQLIPFVKHITSIYLIENGEKGFPENLLSFRNRSGYNYHGLTAATILESCLHVLGFTTKVKARYDLEPKVTLATAHSSVEVRAPDSSRYFVDPCYNQFYEDIGATPLPPSPVLVLREDEVDSYLEEKLMVQWKQNAELVKKGIASVYEKLSEQDQIITYTLKIDDPISSNPEDFVRAALKRILDARKYPTIRANFCFQDIFVGDHHSVIHEHIKQMGIGYLSHYLPFEEVHRRLMQFLHDPSLEHQNSPKALSLIAQLPPEQREKFASLLDLDPRIHDYIGVLLNAYFCSLKKIVNPEGKDLSVIYGCSGADCISVMLATDAQEFTFVDLTPLSYQEFYSALAQMRIHDSESEKALYASLEQSHFFLWQQRLGAGASASPLNLETNKLALKFFFNLRSLGVDLDKVVLSQKGNEMHVDFPWQYHGAASPRKRSVIFVKADITNPEEYPVVLKEKLKKGFDIFYMKAAQYVPRRYPRFLPQFAQSISEGGWLMTTDKSVKAEELPPEKCLEQNGLTFSRYKGKEKKLLEHLLIPAFHPIYDMTSVNDHPQQDRNSRAPCLDLTYWSILNLRKRTV